MNFNLNNYMANNKGAINICATTDWGTIIKSDKSVSLIEYLAPMLATSEAKYLICIGEDMNLAFNAKIWSDFDDAYFIGVWANDDSFREIITSAISEYYCTTVRPCSSIKRSENFLEDIKDLSKNCSRFDIYTNVVETMVFSLASTSKRQTLKFDSPKTIAFRSLCGLSDNIKPINISNIGVPMLVKCNIFDTL